MRNLRRRTALVAAAAVLSLAALPAQADTRSEARWNIGSVLASSLYTPAKVAYATAGALFGGIAWGLSGGQPGILEAVIHPAVRGDYLVRPAHLKRERALVFIGPTDVVQSDDTESWTLEGSYAEDPYDPYEDGYPEY